MELFVFVETYSFVKSILLYKLLALNEFLRAKVSVGLGITQEFFSSDLVSSCEGFWSGFV